MNLIVYLVPLVVVGALVVRALRAQEEELSGYTLESLSGPKLLYWIAFVSGLGLFAELMIIRVHASQVQVFAFFKNVSLFSCFLGLGIGYAKGSKGTPRLDWVWPLLALQLIVLQYIANEVGTRTFLNPVLEQKIFGSPHANDVISFVSVYVLVIAFFVLNALMFVPLGHLASALMSRTEKLHAYSWNLIGSLGGILLFVVCSYFWTPFTFWVTLAGASVLLLLHRSSLPRFGASALCFVLAAFITSIPTAVDRFDFYSPYQKLSLNVGDGSPVIETANTYFQRILDLRDNTLTQRRELRRRRSYYDFPYLFKRGPIDVLVVGSGAGNDVAAALRNGARHVDAVEIDPAIAAIGTALHQEEPYLSERVRLHVTDARAFLRSSDSQYDLIVYGLLDSHILLSSKSGGIRLDSYVYTLEGLEAARRRLKPDGVLCLTVSTARDELKQKLFQMLTRVFSGSTPRAFGVRYDTGFVVIAGENVTNVAPDLPRQVREVTDAIAALDLDVELSTDDWPFFYMYQRTYPFTYMAMLLVLLVVSWVMIRRGIRPTRESFSMPCLFLGAGFMLIEAKGITELALVYGSTWFVTSVVIAAILVMAFAANWLILKGVSLPRTTVYVLLLGSVLLGLLVSSLGVESLGLWGGRLVLTFILTLPLFFSGFAFSYELKNTATVPAALSANLVGAMLGGFLEYNAMYFGFSALYLLALAMYACAFLFARRPQAPA